MKALLSVRTLDAAVRQTEFLQVLQDNILYKTLHEKTMAVVTVT